MIKGEYDYLKALADINECAEHGTPLLVATHPTEAQYVLRCGHDHYPDTIRRIPSLTEEFKQDTLPSGPIEDNIKKRSRKKAMSTNKQLQTSVLGDLPKADLATGEMLAPDQVHALMTYAQKYGLDPYRGHVVVMYGKPYIGLDGYLYHANRTGKPYGINSRPLTESERKDYQIPEGAHAWIAQVLLPDPDRYFPGLGIVTQHEIEARSTKHPEQLRSPVVAAHPQLLAQKRAEWQGM
ncbi:unnamed protein product, partial [marine sediment metagenome]